MNSNFFYILILSILISSCAKRGMISGGPKDSIAPVIVKSNPKNYQINFNSKSIKIDFNEYIKVKDINKQLIVSPPMKKTPTIVPQGTASKFISITLNEDLKPNTTYSFDFGQSISDYNEGIPYSKFKYVFSTGSYIDSLKLTGKINDSFDLKTDDYVSVMLYDAATFNDSLVYKSKPVYVTNTLDKTNYSFENLKAGEYFAVAMKDKNNNYNFQSKSEKIAFIKDKITLPKDSTLNFKLFNEISSLKAYTPTQESANKLYLGFEGNPKDIKISFKENNIDKPLYFSKSEKKSDSLQIFIPKNSKDSINIIVEAPNFCKEYFVKLKQLKVSDTLSIEKGKVNNFSFNENFKLIFTTPIVKIDQTKISLIKKDSTKIKFSTSIDHFNQEIILDFKPEENETYKLIALPGAFEDYYETKNDTLKFDFKKNAIADYGNLKLNFKNIKRFPYIIQIISDANEIVSEKICTKETELFFEAIMPSKYNIRIFYDDNKNGTWDTGNFKEKLQPEELQYFPVKLDVRANWDVEQNVEFNEE